MHHKQLLTGSTGLVLLPRNVQNRPICGDRKRAGGGLGEESGFDRAGKCWNGGCCGSWPTNAPGNVGPFALLPTLFPLPVPGEGTPHLHNTHTRVSVQAVSAKEVGRGQARDRAALAQVRGQELKTAGSRRSGSRGWGRTFSLPRSESRSPARPPGIPVPGRKFPCVSARTCTSGLHGAL